jgi:hypothetical protein
MSFMFNKSENVVSIQEHELVNKVRYEPIMATTSPSYDCYDEVLEATTTCWTWIQTGTSTIHYQEDEWTEVIEDKQFGAEKKAVQQYTPNKTLKQQGERKQTFRVDLPQIKQKKASLEADYRKAIKEKKLEKKFGAEGDLTLFKARVEYGFEPLEQKEGQFYIEIVTEDGRYAHLDPWYDSNWTYRKKITIDNTKVSANHVDFPVYVDLSDVGTTNMNGDCGDIRMTTSDGETEVAREVVDCDELHFLADDNLSSSADKDYYIYYGNASASDYATDATYGAENVWTDYEAVYHLAEDPSGTAPQIIDSTASSTDGTSEGSMTSGNLVSAKIGQGLDFDGSNDAIDLGTPSALYLENTFTVQGWLKGTTASWGGFIDTRKNDNTYYGYVVGVNNTGVPILLARASTGQLYTRGNTDLSDSSWHYVVGTLDKSSATGMKLYTDASEVTYDNQDSPTGLGTMHTDNPAQIGTAQQGGLGYYDGIFDEIRARDTVLSADWISTEYNNQNSPSTFYTVGSEEESGGDTGTTTEEIIERQSEFWF